MDQASYKRHFIVQTTPTEPDPLIEIQDKMIKQLRWLIGFTSVFCLLIGFLFGWFVNSGKEKDRVIVYKNRNIEVSEVIERVEAPVPDSQIKTERAVSQETPPPPALPRYVETDELWTTGRPAGECRCSNCK